MNYWNLLVIILSVVLVAYLLWLYTKQKASSKVVKIAVSMLAIASLACLGIGVYYNQQLTAHNKNEIIIVTEGTSEDSLDLLKKLSNRIYSFDTKLVNPKDNIGLIHSFSDIKDAGIVHLTGFGLEAEQVAAAANYDLKFLLHQPKQQNNFESVHWDKLLRTGEQLTVSGSFNSSALTSDNSKNKNIKLVLEGFGTNLDSTLISAGSRSSFTLRCFPKQLGRAVYSLKVIAGDELIKEEKIPFETTAIDPVKILLLSSSPDFENRFLKSWLFSNQYGLLARNMISTNKFSHETSNMEDVGANVLSATLLGKFDVLVSDASALAAMPQGELTNIRNAVEQSGLGIIIKADSVISRSVFFNRYFNFEKLSVNNKQQLELRGSDSTISLPPLTVERPLSIKNAAANRSIFTDMNGHQFAAAVLAGPGKIVCTSINNSYSWALGGDSISYRRYWSTLINEAAKGKSSAGFRVQPSISFMDQQARLYFETADSLPFGAAINNTQLRLMQDPLLAFSWNAVYWPSKAGWQKVQLENRPAFNWYIFNKDQWVDLQVKNRIKLNQQLAKTTNHKTIATATVPAVRLAAVPKIYFIIIFSICCFYLWIQEKYKPDGN